MEITNRGRVVARLVPAERRKPTWGWARGQGWIADDFDALRPMTCRRSSKATGERCSWTPSSWCGRHSRPSAWVPTR